MRGFTVQCLIDKVHEWYEKGYVIIEVYPQIQELFDFKIESPSAQSSIAHKAKPKGLCFFNLRPVNLNDDMIIT